MHISLTEEIEDLIKDRVASGMYTNSSEVVRAALRKFFNLEDMPISHQEAAYIRSIIESRLQAIENGEEPLLDFDAAFEEAEKQAFGKGV